MVPPEELVKITQLEEDDLIGLHRSLGMWIRNNFGLLKGNKALLQEAGKRDRDDASQVIIRRFGDHLGTVCLMFINASSRIRPPLLEGLFFLRSLASAGGALKRRPLQLLADC